MSSARFIFPWIVRICGVSNDIQRLTIFRYEITPFQFKKWPERNVRLTYIEAINILREAGEDLGDYDDINTAQEKKLGGIVKQRYGTDFFSVHR